MNDQISTPNPDDVKSQAEASKAAADARTAEAGALKAERELVEADSPLAKATKEAEARKAIAEADQQATAAQQKQLSALLPDLSKVTAGSLEPKGDQPLFGAALAQRATAAAAATIADLAGDAIAEPGSARVLVTSDVELATSDAIYVEVIAGLKQLDAAAEKLLEKVEPPTPKTSFAAAAALAAPAVIGAVAAALPGALSLVSAHRSLSTSAVTVDSLSAAAVVSGMMSQREPSLGAVFHDDFRILPDGGIVQTKLADIAQQRQALVGRKIALEDEKARENAELTELKAKVKDASEKLDAAVEAEKEALKSALEIQRKAVGDCERKLGECLTRIGLIDSTTAAMDKFTASLQTTAEGAKRSPLAAAILREQLHSPAGDGARITHVLLIKAEPGSAQQLLDDRPLAFKDKFSTIATSSVTYILIETTQGKVIKAGSMGGEAKASGSIGSEFTIESSALATDK